MGSLRFAFTNVVWSDLAALGIEFGAHGVAHTDLTSLPLEVASEEIADSKRMIVDYAGCRGTSFAPPYGRLNAALCSEVSKHCGASAGTAIARAQLTSHLYNLPRIEMWYFRSERRWRAHLGGEARGYFLLRQILRKARTLAERGYGDTALL